MNSGVQHLGNVEANVYVLFKVLPGLMSGSFHCHGYAVCIKLLEVIVIQCFIHVSFFWMSGKNAIVRATLYAGAN